LKEFNDYLKHQPSKLKNFFGDWANYRGYGDVGYYLGAKFIHYLSRDYLLDDMIKFDMKTIKQTYETFISASI
jgi:hypothetical protein